MGGPVSGNRVMFVGDSMAAVVQGVIEVQRLIGRPPVIVGGVAVLARLSTPYRATVDLDVVDRLLGDVPQLEVLRAADGAESVDPAAVLLPTPYGPVKIDVLEVRQVDLDQPSDDPDDRLYASAHAWANDTATDMTIEVIRRNGDHVEVTTPVAEPGQLIAMKLQAIMNRLRATRQARAAPCSIRSGRPSHTPGLCLGFAASVTVGPSDLSGANLRGILARTRIADDNPS